MARTKTTAPRAGVFAGKRPRPTLKDKTRTTTAVPGEVRVRGKVKRTRCYTTLRKVYHLQKVSHEKHVVPKAVIGRLVRGVLEEVADAPTQVTGGAMAMVHELAEMIVHGVLVNIPLTMALSGKRQLTTVMVEHAVVSLPPDHFLHRPLAGTRLGRMSGATSTRSLLPHRRRTMPKKNPAPKKTPVAKKNPVPQVVRLVPKEDLAAFYSASGDAREEVGPSVQDMDTEDEDVSGAEDPSESGDEDMPHASDAADVFASAAGQDAEGDASESEGDGSESEGDESVSEGDASEPGDSEDEGESEEESEPPAGGGGGGPSTWAALLGMGT